MIPNQIFKLSNINLSNLTLLARLKMYIFIWSNIMQFSSNGRSKNLENE